MVIEIKTTAGHKFDADVNWQDIPGELIDDRLMGGEHLHECYVDIECPICHKKVTRVDVYEYPEGEFNYAEGHYVEDDFI